MDVNAAAVAIVLKNTFIVLVITCLLLLCLYLRKVYNYWEDRGIKYDKPLPIIGNLSFILRKSIWDYFYALKDKIHDDYYGIFFGWTPVLVVQTPELARRILTKDFECFSDRSVYSGYSDPLGSLNIFTLKNPLWKTMRYELSPMFTASRLKALTELMNINAVELVKKIQRDHIKDNKKVNLKDIFSMYTSDTVANTVFGIKVNILNDQPSPLWHITKHMVQWTFWRGFEFTMIFLVPSVAALLRLKFFSADATEYIKKLFWTVAKTRQNIETSNEKDLVNLLLKVKNKLNISEELGSLLSDDVMLAQAAVFILGSIETSSTTLSYLLHELAYQPEKQEKLAKEISEAVKLKGSDVLEYQDLLELKYLTACINETLRKHTPVSYLDRMSTMKYKIDENLTIEKETPVFINVLAIHYNEKYYPEPEKFRPERFLDMAESDNNDFKFLPFGEGPHFCIGKRYGLMQVRASMASMIMNFKFEPAVPYDVKPDPYAVFLAPHDGLSVKFVPR